MDEISQRMGETSQRVGETSQDGLEDRRQFIYFMERIMAFITESPNVEVAAWQVNFAMGNALCIGQSMSSKAQELGCSGACLSKGAVKVCRMLDMPPSAYMLKEKARDSFRQLRIRQEEQREKLRSRQSFGSTA
jgi:hypothetical protein